MAALSSELFCPLATRRRNHVSTPSRYLQKSDDTGGEEQQSAGTGGGSTADGGRLGRLRSASGDGRDRRKRSLGLVRLVRHRAGNGAVKAGVGAGESSTGGARNSGGLLINLGHGGGGSLGSRRSLGGGRGSSGCGSLSGAGGGRSSAGGDNSRAGG